MVFELSVLHSAVGGERRHCPPVGLVADARPAVMSEQGVLRAQWCGAAREAILLTSDKRAEE